LIVDTERGESLSRWLHRFDSILRAEVDWTAEAQTTGIRWFEAGEEHRLSLRHPAHIGFALVSAALRLVPERWLLRSGVARLGARVLGPLLDIGTTPFSGRTETGVPVHLLARELRPVLRPEYLRGGRSSGDGVPYEGGVDLGELSFTRRPVLVRGELFFVPPEPEPAPEPAPGA